MMKDSRDQNSRNMPLLVSRCKPIDNTTCLGNQANWLSADIHLKSNNMFYLRLLEHTIKHASLGTNFTRTKQFGVMDSILDLGSTPTMGRGVNFKKILQATVNYSKVSIRKKIYSMF